MSAAAAKSASPKKKAEKSPFAAPACPSPAKRRKICCDLGSGEVVLVLSFKARPGREECFDVVCQSVAHGLHHLTTGVSDVRVVHTHPPACTPEVIFVVTFISREDRDKFRDGPQKDLTQAFADVTVNGEARFESCGHLMPDSHTFETLLESLKKLVRGTTYREHDIPKIQAALGKWFPRPAEVKKFQHWDLNDPKKYTRNLMYRNEHFELILMCWPPGCRSTIHCHDQSSCWVRIVEGEVWEVQYSIPQLDRKFIEEQMDNPTGAVGRCGPLRKLGETRLAPDTRTTAYVNNTLGVHMVENRSSRPAYTLHCYAPGLRKMKLFKDCGTVTIMSVGAVQYTTEMGTRTGHWGKHTSPDGIIDVEAWNKDRKGCRSGCTHSAQGCSP
eukprot:TRINITY_DN44499_c0_g1_i1.p1 TRINITY_DN44499_c0_g1~~TRINITY_DN44499_c0_g1_i1.p1  ORF type:complete len:405 (+),score=114.14 TRINITY_DN44499_c0_g1_i1:60-1217(+)